MMTGTPNVSNLPLWYQIFTLLLMLPFAWYDFRHHKVCNAALLAFLPWCLLSLPIAQISAPWLPLSLLLLRCFMGFLSGSLMLFMISLATGGGIGGGDIKFVALLGMLYGALHTFLLIFVAALLVLIHMGLQFLHRRQYTRHVPFVPYLWGGCALVTLLMLLAPA